MGLVNRFEITMAYYTRGFESRFQRQSDHTREFGRSQNERDYRRDFERTFQRKSDYTREFDRTHSERDYRRDFEKTFDVNRRLEQDWKHDWRRGTNYRQNFERTSDVYRRPEQGWKHGWRSSSSHFWIRNTNDHLHVKLKDGTLQSKNISPSLAGRPSTK